MMPVDEADFSPEADAAAAAEQGDESVHEEALPSHEAPEGDGEPEPPVPATQYREMEEEKAEIYDRWLRLQAEFDNFRKRTARERLQARDGAIDDVVGSFLAVVDNFDRALAAASESDLPEEYLAGWRMIHQQLYGILENYGVKPMHVIGQMFDPHYHEAVAQIPHDDVPAGHVAAEAERGYLIGERILRAAKVAVSTGMGDA